MKLPNGEEVKLTEWLPYYGLSFEVIFSQGAMEARTEIAPPVDCAGCVIHGIRPKLDNTFWDDAMCTLNYREPTTLTIFQRLHGEVRAIVRHKPIVLGPLWALAQHSEFPHPHALITFDKTSKQLAGFDFIVKRSDPWRFGTTRLRFSVLASVGRDVTAELT